MVQLVAGRVVQGLGSGLIITAIYVVIGEAYPERAAPAAVRRDLVGVGGAVAARPGDRRRAGPARQLALGLPRPGPVQRLGGLLLVPVLRSLHAPDASRPADRPHRLVRALAVAAGIAALEQAGQHPSAARRRRPRPSPGWWRWSGGCAACCRPARSGSVRASPRRSRCAGCSPARSSASRRPSRLSLSEQHGYGATVAGLPLALSGFSWAAGSWWQGRVDDSAGPRAADRADPRRLRAARRRPPRAWRWRRVPDAAGLAGLTRPGCSPGSAPG